MLSFPMLCRILHLLNPIAETAAAEPVIEQLSLRRAFALTKYTPRSLSTF